MGAIVYMLCALTSLLCAILLLREYWRARVRLLLWSGSAFGGFAVSNSLVFMDFVVLPDIDLGLVRASVTLASVSILIVGLLWDAQ
jgi:hypothetical protein